MGAWASGPWSSVAHAALMTKVTRGANAQASPNAQLVGSNATHRGGQSRAYGFCSCNVYFLEHMSLLRNMYARNFPCLVHAR